MADFSGSFADLIPQGGAPIAAGADKFASVFADLVPTKPAPAPLGLMDRAKQFAGGVLSGISNAASASGQAAQIEMGQPVDVPDAATSRSLLEQNVTGPLPVPAADDRLGKFLATSGEFVGNPSSYVGPGSLPAKVGMAVLGGLGSEAGGQLAEGTALEGPARFAGAVIGGGAAAKIAQPAAVEAVIGKAPSAAAPTIEDLEAAYKAVRNSPSVKTATIPVQDVKDLAARAEGELLAEGYRPTPKSAPGTFAEINRLTPKPPPEPTPLQKLQAEMNWETLPEQPQITQATVDDMLAAKRAFRNVANERNPFPDMRPTVDAGAAGKVIPKLDALVEEAAPGMKEANANYAKAQAARSLDTRFDKAESGAANSNSGLNVGNKIRQAATAILFNPNATRGLKPEQLQMLKQVADGTATRNTIRWFSNVLGGGGGLGAVVVGEAASHHLGPIGWLLSPLGHGLKHIEGSMTVAAARKVSEAIRSSSPLGQAIQSSAEKWNAARDALIKGPNSAKFAAFSLASRNLSNNLASAGVKVHPIQLLRSVQGPTESAAEDKQK